MKRWGVQLWVGAALTAVFLAAALVSFITAGDPDFDISLALLKALPGAGADIIELGMPFTDPMADGPAIQAASLRALKSGQTMVRTLEMVRAFRAGDSETPLILMGYYNPIYIYGNERFLADAKAAGVDGLIIVDLPPEEDGELCLPAQAAGIDFIRLATPTTDDARLADILSRTAPLTPAALQILPGLAAQVAHLSQRIDNDQEASR